MVSLDAAMAACSGAFMRAQGEAIPKALSSLCAERAGGMTSCSRLCGQAVKRTWAMRGPRGMELVAVTRPQLPRKPKHARVLRTERLGQEFISDSSHQWDNRSQKKCPRSPEFRHNCTEEVLWVESWSSPPWVKAESSAMNQGPARPKPGAMANYGQSTKSGQIQVVPVFKYDPLSDSPEGWPWPPQSPSVPSAPPEIVGQAMSIDRLWQDFFSNPSHWFDNRPQRKNPIAPDFIHKRTYEGLWIESSSNPAWVKARLSAIIQGQARPESGKMAHDGGRTYSGQPRALEERQAMSIERLWQMFFSDPTQWWDNRFDKKDPRSPDFRHKHTKEGLWIERSSNPPWVKAKLESVLHGELQQDSGGMPDDGKRIESGQARSENEQEFDPRLATIRAALWKGFFTDPGQWWDNRFDKRGPNAPDFRHKRTKEGLWIESAMNPPWVREGLARLNEQGAQWITGKWIPEHVLHRAVDYGIRT